MVVNGWEWLGMVGNGGERLKIVGNRCEMIGNEFKLWGMIGYDREWIGPPTSTIFFFLSGPIFWRKCLEI